MSFLFEEEEESEKKVCIVKIKQIRAGSEGSGLNRRSSVESSITRRDICEVAPVIPFFCSS